MKTLEDKFLKKNIQIWLFGILLTPTFAFWDVVFEPNEVLSVGDFMRNLFFGPILVFSLSTPLWFVFILINRFFFFFLNSELVLNLLINILSIIVGMIILKGIFSIEDTELSTKSFIFIFLHIIFITFFTWIIKVDRGYVKVRKDDKKQGSIHSDILDDNLY
ncbi:MAG: hypothetical protein AB8F94_28555 [Saprospiraceae bacterium]